MEESVNLLNIKIKRINNILKALITCLLIMFNIDIYGTKDLDIKKIYISYIKAKGVNNDLAERARERIEMSIYENFGKEYRVLTDEDIKVMFKKATELMVTSCDAQTCQSELADAIDADEIIYGEITNEGVALKLSARTLLRDRKSLSIVKKSMVILNFSEKEMDHYCSETAKKLINPNYEVKKPKVDEFNEWVPITEVKIDEIKGIDIGIMKFNDSDDSVSNILVYLKEMLKDGDNYFENKQYDNALIKYINVLDRIKTKLTKEKQEKINDFTKSVINRCDTTYASKFKKEISKLDKVIKENKDLSEKEIKKLRDQYYEIEINANKIPNALKGKNMDEIYTALTNRIDNHTKAISSLYEQKGDKFYSEYKFSKALENYIKAENNLEEIINNELRNELITLYLKKQIAVMVTGRNYLISRAQGYIDQSEFFNVQERTRDAKKALARSLNLIEGEFINFVTVETIEIYNEMAKVLGETELNREKHKNIFELINEKYTWYKHICEEEKLINNWKPIIKKFKENGGDRQRNIDGVIFIYIPGGTFMMGSNQEEGDNDEHPKHKVTVDGFWIGKYEVTQDQYVSIMGINPSIEKGKNKPVENVQRSDAISFCDKFSKKNMVIVRLPTEAEWEFACRSGTTTSYYWGNNIDDYYCWHYGNRLYYTHPIGKKKPNAWGLYDMIGNVSELCSDWYDKNYYKKSPEMNPGGPAIGYQQVSRGGCSIYDGEKLRTANRLEHNSGFTAFVEQGFEKNIIGFRLVMEQ